MTTITVDGYVEFNFFRPDASRVFIAGDFNDWRTDHLSMVRKDNGTWRLRLPLEAGAYRFRYVADGVWYTDYASFGVEPGRFGMNSILRVEPKRLKVQQPMPARAVAAA